MDGLLPTVRHARLTAQTQETAMTRLTTGYPSSRTQEATASRRGWTKNRLTGGWSPPKDFSDRDDANIRLAEFRRHCRGIGAD